LVLIAFCTMSVTGWSVYLIGALLTGVSGRGAIIDAVNASTAAVAVVVADGCAGCSAAACHGRDAARITDAYGTRLMTLHSLLISLRFSLFLFLLFFFFVFVFLFFLFLSCSRRRRIQPM